MSQSFRPAMRSMGVGKNNSKCEITWSTRSELESSNDLFQLEANSTDDHKIYSLQALFQYFFINKYKLGLPAKLPNRVPVSPTDLGRLFALYVVRYKPDGDIQPFLDLFIKFLKAMTWTPQNREVSINNSINTSISNPVMHEPIAIQNTLSTRITNGNETTNRNTPTISNNQNNTGSQSNTPTISNNQNNTGNQSNNRNSPSTNRNQSTENNNQNTTTSSQSDTPADGVSIRNASDIPRELIRERTALNRSPSDNVRHLLNFNTLVFKTHFTPTGLTMASRPPWLYIYNKDNTLLPLSHIPHKHVHSVARAVQRWWARGVVFRLGDLRTEMYELYNELNGYQQNRELEVRIEKISTKDVPMLFVLPYLNITSGEPRILNESHFKHMRVGTHFVAKTRIRYRFNATAPWASKIVFACFSVIDYDDCNGVTIPTINLRMNKESAMRACVPFQAEAGMLAPLMFKNSQVWTCPDNLTHRIIKFLNLSPYVDAIGGGMVDDGVVHVGEKGGKYKIVNGKRRYLRSQ